MTRVLLGVIVGRHSAGHDVPHWLTALRIVTTALVILAALGTIVVLSFRDTSPKSLAGIVVAVLVAVGGGAKVMPRR